MTVTEERTAPAVDPRELISPDLFAQLARRVSVEHGVSQDQAEKIMVQALAFLWACAQHPSLHLAPPFDVDWGWHMFILHTKAYAAFCDRVVGRFIHHEPADGQEDGGEAIQRTAAIMRDAGLPVDEEMWSPRGTGCTNTCHNDCNGA
ncbi:glycine-rich domain-containing protein [Spirillospora sp. CA-294931]|uniref:glycine-rich domain-containing protein n=1 Tax=Spirillospora sp. CA-294931 TaxID=3240042 RepID=UPI003D93E6F2